MRQPAGKSVALACLESLISPSLLPSYSQIDSQIVLLRELSLYQDVEVLHRQPRAHLEGVTVERTNQRPFFLRDLVADMLAPIHSLDAEALWIFRHERLDDLLEQLFAGTFAIALDLDAFGISLGEEVVARRVDVFVRLVDCEPLFEADLLQAYRLVFCGWPTIEARRGQGLLLLLDRSDRERDIGEVRSVTTVVLGSDQCVSTILHVKNLLVRRQEGARCAAAQRGKRELQDQAGAPRPLRC